MKIIDKISLRPAVVERNQDEVYLFLSDRYEIFLHDCNSDERLLSPAMEREPVWINTQGPTSLTAWMDDLRTPENCLIAGLTSDSIRRVYKVVDQGILIIRHLTDILALRPISQLVLDSDVTYINTARVRIVTSVWSEIKKNLTYDAALAKERADKHREVLLKQVDRDLAYHQAQIDKYLEEKKRLLQGGLQGDGGVK